MRQKKSFSKRKLFYDNVKLKSILLKRFYNFTGPQASCTNISMLDQIVFSNSHFFNIRHPASSCHIMSVADIVPNHRSFTAYITFFGHDFSYRDIYLISNFYAKFINVKIYYNKIKK